MTQITHETLLDALVDFAQNVRFEDLPQKVIYETKRRLIDSIACAIGGDKDPAVQISKNVLYSYRRAYSPSQADFAPPGFDIILSGFLTPWDSAYLATHMIRVLDWNDTYLSLEPAHPSDNIGALLACCGRRISGREFLSAMAIAYEIQCRFCDAASLRVRGWDHVNYVTIASSLAAGRLLNLCREQMKDGVSLALNSNIVMRQVRTGSQVSMEKGASAGEATRAALWGVVRAAHGLSGPREIFEGEFGFVNQVSGPLYLEAFEDLGKTWKLPQTYIKLYPVEYHAQAAVEAGLALRKAMKDPRSIQNIKIMSYEAARTIIGDEAKRRPQTKESADHSIYYILAVALLDGEMTLRQYKPSRFQDPEVLALIDRMESVQEVSLFNNLYRRQLFPVKITLMMQSGETHTVYIKIPHGHPLRPLSDKALEEKCRRVVGELSWKERMEPLLSVLWSFENCSNVADALSNGVKQ